MPECVILVFSRRQRPKPSYNSRSWCYFSLWPGVMKLWCSKTSPFCLPLALPPSSPQLQTENEWCRAPSIFTSKCKQIVKGPKHKGWGQDKEAEDLFSLIQTEEEIPKAMQVHAHEHHYSQPIEKTHTNNLKSNSGSHLPLPMATLYRIIWHRVYEGNCVTTVTHYKQWTQSLVLCHILRGGGGDEVKGGGGLGCKVRVRCLLAASSFHKSVA